MAKLRSFYDGKYSENIWNLARIVQLFSKIFSCCQIDNSIQNAEAFFRYFVPIFRYKEAVFHRYEDLLFHYEEIFHRYENMFRYYEEVFRHYDAVFRPRKTSS